MIRTKCDRCGCEARQGPEPGPGVDPYDGCPCHASWLMIFGKGLSYAELTGAVQR